MLLNFLKRLVLSKKELFILTENEKWLKENETKMNHLINITDEMIATFSNDGKMLFGNRSWKKHMLYTEDEIKSLTLNDILSFESKMNAEKNLARLIAGETIYNVSCKLIAKNGKEIHAEGTLVPVIENGELTSSQSFFRNINERKDAEDNKLQYIKTLEEMLFSFSHKIRKPVATCLGLIDLLKTEESLSEEKLREFAAYFSVSIKELDGYIHEMSGFLHEKRIKIAGRNTDRVIN